VQTTRNRRHPFDYLFPFGCLLFAVVLLVGLMAGCTNDGNRGGLMGPTRTAAHAYEMVCYNEPPVPGRALVVVRRTVDAESCYVQGGAASGGFVVHCYRGDAGQGWLYSAYLCISFEQVR
jgi:hypothetical protein